MNKGLNPQSPYYQQVKLLVQVLPIIAQEAVFALKGGEPNWELFDHPQAAELPAIRWKLQNLNVLAKNKEKYTEQLSKLEAVLDDWLATK